MSALTKKANEAILASNPSLTEEHNELKLMLIMSCFAVFSLLWCVIFISGEWEAVGFNNSKAKRNRWLNVMLLHLSFIVSVWSVSPSSWEVKLYLTAIMLADPLTFGVYRFPRLQQALQKVWQVLEYCNDQLSVTLLKIFAVIYVISYKLRYDSVSAGLLTGSAIFARYATTCGSLIFFGHDNAIGDQAQEGDRNPTMQANFARLYRRYRPRHIFRSPVPRDFEPQSAPPNAQTQYNLKDTMVKCLHTVGIVIVTHSFMILINAFDEAQRNKLLWFSGKVPQGFYSIIILPNLILSTEFLLDIQMAHIQNPDRVEKLWFALSVINHFFLFNIASNSDTLFLIVPSVAFFASIASYCVWQISRCYEFLATSYSLLMVYNSSVWATVFGLPVFVALFLF